MPKGFLAGKSRQKQPTDAISNPVLRHTDAHPRSDLQPSEAATCGRPPQTIAFHRPGTSDGRPQGKRRAAAPGLDLKAASRPIRLPPHRNPDGLKENTIGIALGSPRLVESQMVSQRDDYGCSAGEGKARAPEERSRWRKIGGFFKAKRALSSPPPQPFYQLRVEGDWPLQGSTCSVEAYRHVSDLVPQEEDQGEGVAKDEWPCLNSGPASGDRFQDTGARTNHDSRSPQLEVEIPSVQLERYSVMFGGLFGGKPSPARSSKLPPSQDLPMNQPPRPAASPRPKTPSFALFPATNTGKASKVLGTQNLPPSSPLVQSQNMEQLQRLRHQRHFFGAIPSPVDSPIPPEHQLDSSGIVESGQEETYSGGQHMPHAVPDEERVARTIPPGRSTPPRLKINTDVQSFRPRSSRSVTPLSGRTADSATKTKLETSPSKSPLMPLTDKDEDEDEDEDADAKETANVPNIEVSVARSVSVSKGKKQAIVPIGRRADLDPDERLVNRGARTPLVTDVQHGHRPGKSQDVQIETL